MNLEVEVDEAQIRLQQHPRINLMTTGSAGGFVRLFAHSGGNRVPWQRMRPVPRARLLHGRIRARQRDEEYSVHRVGISAVFAYALVQVPQAGQAEQDRDDPGGHELQQHPRINLMTTGGSARRRRRPAASGSRSPPQCRCRCRKWSSVRRSYSHCTEHSSLRQHLD